MARGDFAFHHSFRVRWSETDAQGVVFNARYLDYADVAVTEYWRAVQFRKYADGAPMDSGMQWYDVTAQPLERRHITGWCELPEGPAA
jgi:acyl-CoA thioesterase FadM